MDLDLYDEFGNYIGPELDDSQSDDSLSDQQESDKESENESQHENQLVPKEGTLLITQDIMQNQIVLHEDKKYYPSAEEVYGSGVESMVQEEDTQPLTQPIIAPVKEKIKFVHEKDLPVTFYNKEYLLDVLGFPELTRNISLVGHLHHGKTAFMDMMITHTHDMHWDLETETRYTDVHLLERDRGISVKSMPMTFLLQNERGKSYALNFMDTPGHCNFTDEVTCALRVSDGAVLLIDAVEGVFAETNIR
jgi:116 kDa U5 small nuclear ribonucleoprotein component